MGKIIEPTEVARPQQVPYASALYKTLVSNPYYVAQAKINGTRVLAENGRAWSRHGIPVVGPVSIWRDMDDLVVDGELVKDKFYAFDLLGYKGKDVSREPWHMRIMLLNTALLRLGREDVVQVPAEIKAKDEAYRRWLELGHEGMVLKCLHDPYPRAENGCSWLKVKP
jgi:hypothetical protein